MGGPKAKIPKIRIKTTKSLKAEKMSKEMLEADSMLIKPDEMDIDPKGGNENFDTDSEGDILEIDETDQLKTALGPESDKEDDLIENENFCHQESRAMLRHIFGLMESQLHYGTDKPWAKFAQDSNISFNLLIKLTLKNYARIHGNEGESSAITMASSVNYEAENVKALLAPLVNKVGQNDKLAELESKLELINSQGIENMSRIEKFGQNFSKNSQFSSLKMVVTTLTKEMTELQNLREKGDHGKDTDDQATKLDKAKVRFPYTWDQTLSKLSKKQGDLNTPEILQGIAGAVAHCDPLVTMVLFETLGLKINNSTIGKPISEFIKILVVPISIKNAESRIFQKLQFNRVFSAWDTILKNVVNPGSLCATTIIEECRVCYFALKDISAETLPLGLKVRALGMMCMVPGPNQQRNSAILEKIMELKPTSIPSQNYSYSPWPTSNEGWSPTMLSWSRGKLPKLKSASYADIDLPRDIMTNCVARKEFPYFSENGNKNKILKQKQNVNISGDSGNTVWDLINGNNN
jgi:hypothetical protein